jgi:cytoskeletal protein CcmA (bactofilin family)
MIRFREIAAVLLFLLTSAAWADDRFGELIEFEGVINDDTYAAGEKVTSSARIGGDLVTAGGELRLGGEVMADILAAGGEVLIRGRVHDDVRVAAGELLVQAVIRDDLIAAGGRIRLDEGAWVGGDSWLTGGEVIIEGRLNGPLQASAGTVIISGSIASDVLIWADEIEIMPGARIDGDLRYRSPEPAVIHEGAVVTGDVIHTEVDVPTGPVIAGLLFMLALMFVSLLVTAVVLYLLFNRIADQAAVIIREGFWSSVGLGLAMLAATPVVIVLLLSTGIGSLLAAMLLLVYVLLIITGYLSGAYAFTMKLRGLFTSGSPGRLTGSLWITVGLLVLNIIALVPILGFAVGLLVMTSGIGALTKLMYRANNVPVEAGGTD